MLNITTVTTFLDENWTTVEYGSGPNVVTNAIITAVVILFLIVGSFGNILTIVVILKTKSLHIPSNFFILSLCCSDLISALICSPLWLYRRTWGFNVWYWTEPLCEFYWFSDFTTNYATSLHILSFAALRYFAIKRPFRISKITKKKILIYVSCLWVLSIIIALPLIAFMGVVDNRAADELGNKWPSCSICNDPDCLNNYNLYISITSPILFYVPELCVIIFSLLIAKALLKRRRWRRKFSNVYSVNSHMSPQRHRCYPCVSLPDVVYNAHAVNRNLEADHEHDSDCSRDSEHHETSPHPSPEIALSRRHLSRTHALEMQYHRERNTFTQLSLIVVAFMIGYIPQTVYLLWTTTSTLHSASAEDDYAFGVAAYLCLRLSECMNPVMYNLGSSNIRKASKEILQKAFRFS